MTPERGDARLREVISSWAAWRLPVTAWEQDVLPLRVAGLSPPLMDALCASGEVVWIGAGEGKVALYLRDDVSLLRPAGADRTASGHRRYPRCGFVGKPWRVVLPRTGGAGGEPERAVLSALWELVWAGTVTNDAWHPLRSGGRDPASAGAAAVLRRRARPTAALPAALGRWSLVSPPA